jgi:hypothetical protein
MFLSNLETAHRSRLYAFALFMLVVTMRVIYVSLFAGEIPFWDQWDAEAALLLKPWQDGTWSLAQLFSPHNEHRIALTRVLSIITFELNGGQWNNLVSAYINTLIVGTYTTTLYALLNLGSSRLMRCASFVLVGLVSVLPYSWENFLVGFQSQFYLMTLFAILMVAVAATRAPGSRTTLLLCAIGTVSLFTTASGLVGAIGTLVVISARAYQRQSYLRIDFITSLLMLLVVLIGVQITPSLAGHAVFQAHGLRDNLQALVTALMWPVQPLPLSNSHFWFHFKVTAAAAIWCPSVLWLVRFLRTRASTSSGFVALGMSAWAFVQAVAIAHSRGHDMVALASRYMDIPAMAVIVNGWFVIDLLAAVPRTARARWVNAAVGIAFCSVALFGFVSRRDIDRSGLTSRAYFTGKETANVAAYIRTGDPEWLQQPTLEIPYPEPARLRSLLDDPTIAAMLPPSLRRPLSLTDDRSSAFSEGRVPPAQADTEPGALGNYTGSRSGASVGHFRSRLIQAKFSYIEIATAGSMNHSGSARLWLHGGEVIEYFSAVGTYSDNWRRAFARVPASTFTIEADSQSKDSWLAFAAPVEAGPLSAGAAWLQDEVRRLVYRFIPSMQQPLPVATPHVHAMSVETQPVP